GFAQLIRQTIGASSVLAFSAIGTLVIALLLKYTIGLRLNVEDEVTGIDEAEHAESGYDLAVVGSSPVHVNSAEEGKGNEADHRDREAVHARGHQSQP
ncbi:MAG TPA: ammonia channel protein, partial [Mycobacterium sp.]|nr:ammonia channel protein [Mycobacterium sp.]